MGLIVVRIVSFFFARVVLPLCQALWGVKGYGRCLAFQLKALRRLASDELGMKDLIAFVTATAMTIHAEATAEILGLDTDRVTAVLAPMVRALCCYTLHMAEQGRSDIDDELETKLYT